jgi:hypothetical protein
MPQANGGPKKIAPNSTRQTRAQNESNVIPATPRRPSRPIGPGHLLWRLPKSDWCLTKPHAGARTGLAGFEAARHTTSPPSSRSSYHVRLGFQRQLRQRPPDLRTGGLPPDRRVRCRSRGQLRQRQHCSRPRPVWPLDPRSTSGPGSPDLLPAGDDLPGQSQGSKWNPSSCLERTQVAKSISINVTF